MVTQTTFSDDASLSGTGLACERGFQTLFEDLGFSVRSGQAMQIAGANGVGKTSLLRIIASLGLSVSGEIYWNNVSISSNLSTYRAAMTYLGHKQGLKADLTPFENLAFASRIGGYPDVSESGINELLARFDIHSTENRPVRQLSAGQQQRVSIARMQLAGSPVWLMDEPATSLDHDAVSQLNGLMNAHLQKNGIIIFTSHQPFEIETGRLLTLTLQRVQHD